MLTYVDPDPYRAHTHIANNPRFGSGPWMSLKLCPAAPFEGQPNLCGRCCLKEYSFIEYLDISWYSRLSSHLSIPLFSHLISSLTSPHVYLSLSPSFSRQMCYLLCTTTRVYFMCILVYTGNNKLGSWNLGLRCHHCSPVRYFCGALQHYALRNDDKSKTESMICPLNGGEYMWIYVNITSYEYHVPDLSSDFDCEKPGRQSFDP